MTYHTDKLSDYLINQIITIANYLNIKTEIIISSNIKKNNQLKAQDKILHICEILGAKEYINAIGGKKLYSFLDFAKRGLELKFLKTLDVQYRQFSTTFVPNLSIIDLMMFNDMEAISKILTQYDLEGEK